MYIDYHPPVHLLVLAGTFLDPPLSLLVLQRRDSGLSGGSLQLPLFFPGNSRWWNQGNLGDVFRDF